MLIRLGRGEGQTQTSWGLGLEGAELWLVGGERLMSAGPGSKEHWLFARPVLGKRNDT